MPPHGRPRSGEGEAPPLTGVSDTRADAAEEKTADRREAESRKTCAQSVASHTSDSGEDIAKRGSGPGFGAENSTDGSEKTPATSKLEGALKPPQVSEDKSNEEQGTAEDGSDGDRAEVSSEPKESSSPGEGSLTSRTSTSPSVQSSTSVFAANNNTVEASSSASTNLAKSPPRLPVSSAAGMGAAHQRMPSPNRPFPCPMSPAASGSPGQRMPARPSSGGSPVAARGGMSPGMRSPLGLAHGDLRSPSGMGPGVRSPSGLAHGGLRSPSGLAHGLRSPGCRTPPHSQNLPPPFPGFQTPSPGASSAGSPGASTPGSAEIVRLEHMSPPRMGFPDHRMQHPGPDARFMPRDIRFGGGENRFMPPENRFAGGDNRFVFPRSARPPMYPGSGPMMGGHPRYGGMHPDYPPRHRYPDPRYGEHPPRFRPDQYGGMGEYRYMGGERLHHPAMYHEGPRFPQPPMHMGGDPRFQRFPYDSRFEGGYPPPPPHMGEGKYPHPHSPHSQGGPAPQQPGRFPPPSQMMRPPPPFSHANTPPNAGGGSNSTNAAAPDRLGGSGPSSPRVTPHVDMAAAAQASAPSPRGPRSPQGPAGGGGGGAPTRRPDSLNVAFERFEGT